MRRTGLLVAGWALATVLALALGLLGVRAVSNSVTRPRPAALSAASIRAMVADATTESRSSSDDSSESSPTDVASGVGDPTESRGSSGVAGPSTDGGTESESPSQTPSDQSGAGDGSGGAGDNDTGDETAPVDRTYQLVGGSVGVRFENGAAHLLWAQPNAGYSVEASGSGSSVDVLFQQVDGDHESRLKAYWHDGPQQEIEEK